MTTNRLALSLACAVLALLACPAAARAQTVFQDADGESSIFLRDNGGFARVNVAEKKISLGYLFDRGDDTPHFGFEISGKRSGDLASIFKGGVPGNEAEIKASVGKRFLLADAPNPRTAGQIIVRRVTMDWLTFEGSYKRSSYNLVTPGNVFANQVRKQNFDGFSATLGYNMLIDLQALKGGAGSGGAASGGTSGGGASDDDDDDKNKTPSSMIVGFSAGVKRRNNAGDLDEVEVEDVIFPVTDGTVQRRVISTQQALLGDYKESIAAPINGDVVYFPGHFDGRMALDFFFRSNVGEGDRNFVPGVGLFITKSRDTPTKVLGGISIAVRDGKAQVGLVAGFHF
jgi:hypothetical protein